jgi:hypothetical protein
LRVMPPKRTSSDVIGRHRTSPDDTGQKAAVQLLLQAPTDGTG